MEGEKIGEAQKTQEYFRQSLSYLLIALVLGIKKSPELAMAMNVESVEGDPEQTGIPLAMVTQPDPDLVQTIQTQDQLLEQIKEDICRHRLSLAAMKSDAEELYLDTRQDPEFQSRTSAETSTLMLAFWDVRDGFSRLTDDDVVNINTDSLIAVFNKLKRYFDSDDLFNIYLAFRFILFFSGDHPKVRDVLHTIELMSGKDSQIGVLIRQYKSILSAKSDNVARARSQSRRPEGRRRGGIE